MKYSLIKAIMAVCFLSSTFGSADQIYVGKPKKALPSGVDSETLVELLETAATELGHEVVGDPGEADYVIRPRLMQLGTSYILAIRKYKNGKVISSKKLKAREIEELDLVAKRLMRTVSRNPASLESMRVDEVTIDEVNKGNLRRDSRKGPYAFGGVAFLGELGSVGPSYHISVGQSWGVGTSIALGIGSDFTFDLERNRTPALFIGFKGFLAYYFIPKDFSPFLAAEIGFAWARSSSTLITSGGFMTGATLGFAFLRTYKFPIVIGFHGSVLFDTVHAETPKLIGIRVGVSL